jgi:hypothetical protein
MRYILMYFASGDRPELDSMRDRPDVEVYRLRPGPDLEDQIDMALLNDLITPLKLAFVGGDEAKTFANEYGGVWIPDGPTVEADVRRFWDLAPADQT